MKPPHLPDYYESADDDTGKEEPTGSARSFSRALVEALRTFLQTILPALILALLLTHFVAQGEAVLGHSMEPNLHTGQRLIVEKLSYRFSAPRRGDIVVIEAEGSEIPLIKRVIGLPGETIEIRQNKVFVDGQPLEEPYLSPDVSQPDYGPIRIPPGRVFVLGDNRGSSQDSRYYGPLPIDDIIGRAWFSYWPLQNIGPVR